MATIWGWPQQGSLLNPTKTAAIKVTAAPGLTNQKLQPLIAAQQQQMFTKFLYSNPYVQQKVGYVRGVILAAQVNKATPLTAAQKQNIVNKEMGIQIGAAKSNAKQYQLARATIPALTTAQYQEQNLGMLTQDYGSLLDKYNQLLQSGGTSAGGGTDWMSLIPMALVAMILMAGIGVLKK